MTINRNDENMRLDSRKLKAVESTEVTTFVFFSLLFTALQKKIIRYKNKSVYNKGAYRYICVKKLHNVSEG